MMNEGEQTTARSTGRTLGSNTGVCYNSELESPLYATSSLRLLPAGVRSKAANTLYALSPIVRHGCVPSAGVHRL